VTAAAAEENPPPPPTTTTIKIVYQPLKNKTKANQTNNNKSNS